MNIENEIFKKSKIIYEKLIPYGFKKTNNKYLLSQNIINNTLRVEIEISDIGTIHGKIYDLELNEEYINHKIENQLGEFTNKVREEYQNILIDIKNNCTITNYFITPQANRITKLIIQKYNNTPEFLWTKYPNYGIFRNSKSNKWYGIIMNINQPGITKKDQEIEILNVKLPPSKIKNLLKRKGFYKAYHMNKKNWLTILLDNTIKDEEIIKYIDESHKLTE